MVRSTSTLPAFVEPMLATLAAPFESDRHGYELKWDGFRALCFVDADGLRLVGRRKTVFTDRFPELDVLGRLPRGTLLDGEIVTLTEGRPDFAALLARERSWSGSSPANRRPRRHAPVTFVAFDALYAGGRSILREPLVARRERLERIVAPHVGPRLEVSEMTTGNGLALFAEVSRLGLEGVVAKRLDGPYEPGARSGSWSKFKRRQSVACLILGYEPSTAGGIKSLILAADVDGELKCVGQVGSGIGDARSSELLRQFAAESATRPVVACNIRRGRWIRPGRFCRVSFAEWTDAGQLRQPVFEQMIDAPAPIETESMDAAGRPTPISPPKAPARAGRGRSRSCG